MPRLPRILRPLIWLAHTPPSLVAGVNLALLVSLCAWIRFDAYFDDVVGLLRSDLLGDVVSVSSRQRDELALRVDVLGTIAASGAATLLWLFALMFAAPKRRRGLRSAFVAMTLVACWIGVATSLDQVLWWAKCRRMALLLPDLEQKAEILRVNWPTTDGELPGVGSFVAYPLHRGPTVLMFIDPRQVGRSASTLSQVTRSPGGAMRFHIVGPDSGWIEWRPRGEPASYTDGLGVRHELQQSSPLDGHWRLVHYQDRVGPF